ncbi:uncharacterized protein K452DRAFT_326140 [Aplosporella prunicola CBS 121167]|uniref:Pre-rRNA-processing protein RIX1 n=1 Tax=Aplosporella prunicola CBS 121167 TaxID=1176127 RepID=A0A6A6BFH8_9PEZI|nr:uncharacterized protein K452DRAFT_326140 [Aplosporella prunicola CBS 121167]KAF2142922.1 hypothetical protein K452DRAFT_326140 [Aplosporella prunicola CBS 121167]
MDPYAVTALRSVSYRIASTPTKHLPAIIPHVTAALLACRPLLSLPLTSSAKDASEAAVLVHKFRTQISTLLQDRSVEGRWAGAVLVKSAVELGGWETLQKCGPWVRGLLGILSKPDPSTTKVFCIVTLTRIFMLTRDYQTLVREITTPSLTPFITSCMNILTRFKDGDASLQHLTETVLESFSRLLPRHPTVFRPHLTKIGQFLATVIAPAQENLLTAEGDAAARRLYTQIPCCAAKGASQQDWEKSFQTVVAASHQTADKVFRAIIEDWESVTGVQSFNNNNVRAVEQEVQQSEPDLCGFPAWTGIYAGSRRLIGLLDLLTELTIAPTASVVSFRIAHVMDLLTRILSLTAPAAAKGRKQQESGITFNDQISRDERNDLWVVLPHVHVAAISLFEALVERFGQALAPVMEFFLERLSFLFQEEWSLASIRTAAYSVLTQLLPILGQALPTAQVKSLNRIMHACCNDLAPREKVEPAVQPSSTTAANGNKNKQPQVSMNADTFLGTAKPKNAPQSAAEGLYESAYALLPCLLTYLPAHAIDHSARNHMESTAVLIRHEKALLASVMNLPSSGNTQSLLPLLARIFPESPDVEMLLRPRMPVIKVAGREGLPMDVDEEEEEEDEDEGENENAEEKAENAGEPENDQMQKQAEAANKGAPIKAQEEPVSATKESTEKRPSEETAPQAPSPKRLRVGSPGRIALQEQKVEAAASSAKPAPAPAVASYGGNDAEEEDDEDMEIPTLVMDDDEEDSDNE